METTMLVDKMFSGMPDRLVTSILGQKRLLPEEIQRLKDLIQNFPEDK